MRKLPAASRFWTSCEMKNLRNSTASFGAPLVTSQPLMPPSVSLGSPLPPETVGKSNHPSLSSLSPTLSAASTRWVQVEVAEMARIIAALPSPK